MSGKGNGFENAVVETFFEIIKAELIWRHKATIRNRGLRLQ
jgi:hypothetical protein